MKSIKELFSKIDYNRIAYHVLFWVIITMFYDIISSTVYSRELSQTLIIDILFYVPTELIGVYFTIYFLMPKFLYKKKYWQFSIWFFIFFATLVMLIGLPLERYGIKLFYEQEYLAKGWEFPDYWQYVRKHFLWTFTTILMIIGLASSIKFLKFLIKTQKHKKALIKEKLETELKLKEAELNYLKSQINPHFLFNALNNLYSLTLEKSDLAPKIVLKISSLLDYILYECNEPFTDLYKEAENLRNYVDLQKIRYGESVNIELNISDSLDDERIAPLLLLPFVENAFKHGPDKNVGEGIVSVEMNTNNDNMFYFKTENTKNNVQNNGNSGIGLQNVKKRLELQYPGKYELNIEDSENKYIVELSIDLGKENIAQTV